MAEIRSSRLSDWWRSGDAQLLKRTAIGAYFGSYALIALGAREAINVLLAALPGTVRPPLIAPLPTTLGLPTSVAWSLTSLAIAIAAVAAVAGSPAVDLRNWTRVAERTARAERTTTERCAGSSRPDDDASADADRDRSAAPTTDGGWPGNWQTKEREES